MQSICLYRTHVWNKVLHMKEYKELLNKLPMRMFIIRITSVYKTSSGEQAWSLWIYLHWKGTCIKQVEDKTWQRNSKANTRRNNEGLAKKMGHQRHLWVTCKFRREDYSFTQFLTAYRSFWSYTLLIQMVEDDSCIYCE